MMYKKWYTYIILTSKNTYYTGISTDVKKRVETHNKGKVKYTRSKLPVRLLVFWIFDTKSEAAKEEYRIKKLNRKQKEELLRLTN